MIGNTINRFLTRLPHSYNIKTVGYNFGSVGNLIWNKNFGINSSLTRSSIFNSNVSESISNDILNKEFGYTIIPISDFKVPYTNVASFIGQECQLPIAGNIGSRVESFSIDGTTCNTVISYNGVDEMDGRGNERMELKKRLYKSYKSRKLSLPSTKSRRRHMQSNR